MAFIEINDGTVRFFYTDSGIPNTTGSYFTIIAVHGCGFNGAIFKKVQQLAPAANLRIVALNRRMYRWSTDLTDLDLRLAVGGSDDEKPSFIDDRSVELAEFVKIFIEKNRIPAISSDGSSGGVALLGWSIGVRFVLSAIAKLDQLSNGAKVVFWSHLRSLILLDPPTRAIGAPTPPNIWSPQIDTTIPSGLRNALFIPWITSYFKHGDLTTCNPDVLSCVVPSLYKRPTLYNNMSPEDIHEIVEDIPELQMIYMSLPQAFETYRKALFDATIRELVPRMKIWQLTGDETTASAIACFWFIQDDDKAHGGGFINFKLMPGANHFMHWDEPELTLQALQECLV